MRLLGTIAAANAASTSNETTTGTGTEPFELPKYPCTLFFVPSATGLKLAFKATAVAGDFPLGADSWGLPWAGRESGLVALRNDTGSARTCAVYATDNDGTITRVPAA